MIRTLHEGLLAEGISVPLVKLCAWFSVPRRTIYYKPTKAAPKVDPRLADPIKAMIEVEPSFGYRTVAWLLGFNKTRFRGSSRSRAGRFANDRSVCGLGSRRYLPSPRPRTSAGRRICAAFGQDEMAGQHLRWLSTVTPASCWAGTSPDLARPRQPPAPWSML